VRLILASASPRRAELLAAAGFDFEIVPADVDETPLGHESPEAYTLRVAREKARRIARRLSSPDIVVLAADTEVAAGGQIFGKPRDAHDARRMLRLLSGDVHDVLTAVVLLGPGGEAAEVVTTRVQVAALTGEEIEWYVETGEPMGKAGGYAIQGRGARFIERIEGSWSNVVGLPVATVYRRLAEVQ
jgi:septum formation protein